MNQKGTSSVAVLVTILVLTAVVGGGFYYWQNSKQEPAQQTENKVTADTESKVRTEQKAQFETMAAYVETAIDMEPVSAPTRLVQVKFGDSPVDVKLPEASVPMYVFAEPNWEVGSLEDVQLFYIKSETPASFLEDPSEQKQEFWYGPFYGKLKLLVQ
jgi:hypothetical protein